jgi:hypothetical protein
VIVVVSQLVRRDMIVLKTKHLWGDYLLLALLGLDAEPDQPVSVALCLLVSEGDVWTGPCVL